MFYPQLVAGPIERPQNLLPQLHAAQRFDPTRVVSGLRLMLEGLFKKVMIADRLAVVVDAAYRDPSAHSGLALAIATYFFAFQIYCDFSGYSDIAVGAARVMGFELMTNFNRPYLARSVSDFWRRWHISLSSWFRDYVYIPLGGNRSPPLRRNLNLLVVFTASGLWHGAKWTFVVWGGLHGLLLICGNLTRGARARLCAAAGLERVPRVRAVLKTVFIFHLALVGWVFFRANTVGAAWAVLRRMVGDPHHGGAWNDLGVGAGQLAFDALLIAAWMMVEIDREQGRARFSAWPPWMRWSVYYAAVLAMVFFGAPQAAQFIYFQF
jgi:D-alanyl-lipoteichoic acid acyltransferase DltB (MBOAT superfamily)